MVKKDKTSGKYEQAILELRESLGWVDSVFGSISEGILVVEENLKVLFANDAAADMVATPRIKLLGDPIWEILELTANGKQLSGKAYEDAARKDELESLSGRYELPDDLTIDVTISTIPQKNQAVFTLRDVTIQMQNERQLTEKRIAHSLETAKRQKTEENEQLLQQILDGTSAIIFLKDLAGHYIMANNQFKEVFGVEGEVTGKTDAELFGEEIAESLQKNDAKVLTTKKSMRWEENITADGAPHTYLYLKFPLLNSANEPHSLCGVLTDITARKELEKRREDFIKVASHELKTPLLSITINGEIIKKHIRQEETEKALNSFKQFENQVQKLKKLIDELLDASQLETGKLELNLKPFTLNSLVKETINVAQSTTQTHHIQLVEKSSQLTVTADPQRIEQILINLLTNAIKYSPDGGEIIVRIQRSDEQVMVSVQDFGIGIDEKHQQKIFDRFYRDDTQAGQFSGLGMGLFISARIIEQHGGTISVQSSKGQGSIFTFQLPLK